MQGTLTTFWGKLHRHDANAQPILHWHPLHDHCADVAACAEALLCQPLLRQRLAQLANLADLSTVQISRLCVLVALHDIGKHNLGFQNKANPTAHPKAGHVQEVSTLFEHSCHAQKLLFQALELETLMAWGTPDEDIVDATSVYRLLLASIGHHGKPAQTQGNPTISNWQAQNYLDPFRGIAQLLDKAKKWFPSAFQEGGELLPGATAFQHAFSGLVMLADWLGSDTKFFRYTELGDGDRILFAREQAALTLAGIGLNPTTARNSLGINRPGFSSVSTFSPNAAQQATQDLPISPNGTVTVLESETGSGKTEAALSRFILMFHQCAVDGLYFALPTRTAATQLYRRTCQAVERAFPTPETRPPVVLAVPGYLDVDGKQGQRLPGFEVLWNDDPHERFRYRGWAAENPKRYLAGVIVVGTIDQVLLSTLAVSHSHLRATTLLRHLLVVDEVHASDAYMNRLLEEVLSRHIQAGGHAFLMSATLGSQTLARLLNVNQKFSLPSLNDALGQSYPLLTHRAPNQAFSTQAITAPGNPKTVQVSLHPWMELPTKIAEKAYSEAARGARVVILRNTVRDCVATQEAVERLATDTSLLFQCDGIVAPHHARFSKEDRTSLDAALEKRVGKGTAAGGCIVVATQTIQQSLDLDFDLMLTDLCPMDVLLQRAGRVHRHERSSRPDGLEQPTLWVLTPENRDLGLLLRKNGTAQSVSGVGSVYDDLSILQATLDLITANEILRIPENNRELVEKSTHPEALKYILDKSEAWRKHSQQVSGKQLAERLIARNNLANWNAPMGTPEVAFPSPKVVGGDELWLRIQTRLGEADRLAQFSTYPMSPFGNQVKQLTLPAYLARDIPDEETPKLTEHGAWGFNFSFGSKPFRYDRLGLRLIEDSAKGEKG